MVDLPSIGEHAARGGRCADTLVLLMPQARLAVVVSLTLAVGACAPTGPPGTSGSATTSGSPATSESAVRRAVILRLVEPCQRQFPYVQASVDDTGRLQTQAPANRATDLTNFRRCVSAEAKRSLNVTDAPLAAGRVRPGFNRASVPIQTAGSAILVTANVNGAAATLLLDTGATYTILNPRLAQRAGVTPAPGAPKIMGSVVGGQIFVMPYVRLRVLGVGEALVEEIEVGVYNALPHRPTVDGLLGANFLNHFRVTIDRGGRSLVLEPSRAGARVGPPISGTLATSPTSAF